MDDNISNEPFEVRKDAALIEIKEVLKKYQLQMRAELTSNQVSIVAQIMVHDLVPQPQGELDIVG